MLDILSTSDFVFFILDLVAFCVVSVLIVKFGFLIVKKGITNQERREKIVRIEKYFLRGMVLFVVAILLFVIVMLYIFAT